MGYNASTDGRKGYTFKQKPYSKLVGVVVEEEGRKAEKWEGRRACTELGKNLRALVILFVLGSCSPMELQFSPILLSSELLSPWQMRCHWQPCSSHKWQLSVSCIITRVYTTTFYSVLSLRCSVLLDYHSITGWGYMVIKADNRYHKVLCWQGVRGSHVLNS